jgi:hypothetical protein
MKTFVFLASFLVGFGYLAHHFSFWFALCAIYLAGMGLVSIIAFSKSISQKLKTTIDKDIENATLRST